MLCTEHCEDGSNNLLRVVTCLLAPIADCASPSFVRVVTCATILCMATPACLVRLQIANHLRLQLKYVKEGAQQCEMQTLCMSSLARFAWSQPVHQPPWQPHLHYSWTFLLFFAQSGLPLCADSIEKSENACKDGIRSKKLLRKETSQRHFAKKLLCKESLQRNFFAEKAYSKEAYIPSSDFTAAFCTVGASSLH